MNKKNKIEELLKQDLENLIQECGLQFESLDRYNTDREVWYVACGAGEREDSVSPKEAVIKLLLKLRSDE